MAKMSQYTPLDENDKEYFFGEGEGAVVTVGETNASSGKVNRLVKLSDIGGGDGGLPEIGSNDDGKVLTVDTDHAVWAEPSGGTEYQGVAPISITGYSVGSQAVELNYMTDDFDVDQSQTPHRLKLVRPVPSTLAANDGDVLTIDDHAAGSLTWTTPGGGGFASMPKETVAISGTPDGDNHYTQTINIVNNKYNIASGNIDHYCDNLEIRLASTDYPDAIVEVNTSMSTSDLDYIFVYNGSSQLKRLYPSHTLLDTSVIQGSGYGGAVTIDSVTEFFQNNDTIFIRILGNSYTILTGKSTLKVSGGE
jgi:hypothetical protein